MSAIQATRDTVALQNDEAERTLVGSLLIDGDVFAAFCDQVDPEWLADDVSRLYFEPVAGHDNRHKAFPRP